MTETAVILLNYMSWEDTLAEMGLLKERLGIAYEDMVVIDNASPNGAAARLAHLAEDLGYTFLEAGHNGGYASGNNIGLRYALEKGYQYGWVMNNDILIEDRHILDKLVNVLKSAPDIAVVNPDIYSPDGHMYNRDAKRPSLFDQTAGALFYIRRGRQVKDMGGYAYIYRPRAAVCCWI